MHGIGYHIASLISAVLNRPCPGVASKKLLSPSSDKFYVSCHFPSTTGTGLRNGVCLSWVWLCWPIMPLPCLDPSRKKSLSMKKGHRNQHSQAISIQLAPRNADLFLVSSLFSAQNRRLSNQNWHLMTVGFLYRAGAETLIFVTGASGKYPKLFVSRQKTKVSCGYSENQENRCLGIRC